MKAQIRIEVLMSSFIKKKREAEEYKEFNCEDYYEKNLYRELYLSEKEPEIHKIYNWKTEIDHGSTFIMVLTMVTAPKITEKEISVT